MNFFNHKVALAQEYLGFVLLNLTDLFMTGYILAHEGLEANKAANWVLASFGLRGFAVYKFLLTTVVILACEGIALKSMRKAKSVILLGSIILTFVVCYESFIIITHIHMKPREPANIVEPLRLPRGNEAEGAQPPERVRIMLAPLPENRPAAQKAHTPSSTPQNPKVSDHAQGQPGQ
jgi:hypothetical protein